jgi:hypothetical protein
MSQRQPQRLQPNNQPPAAQTHTVGKTSSSSSPLKSSMSSSSQQVKVNALATQFSHLNTKSASSSSSSSNVPHNIKKEQDNQHNFDIDQQFNMMVSQQTNDLNSHSPRSSSHSSSLSHSHSQTHSLSLSLPQSGSLNTNINTNVKNNLNNNNNNNNKAFQQQQQQLLHHQQQQQQLLLLQQHQQQQQQQRTSNNNSNSSLFDPFTITQDFGDLSSVLMNQQLAQQQQSQLEDMISPLTSQVMPFDFMDEVAKMNSYNTSSASSLSSSAVTNPSGSVTARNNVGNLQAFQQQQLNQQHQFLTSQSVGGELLLLLHLTFILLLNT